MEEFLKILGGTTAVLGALFWFLGKAAISRILENERKRTESELSKLKKELDKSIHIGKAQFDLEFQIYQTVWKQLVSLKQATLSLRPILDHTNPNESENERKQRRVKVFSEAFYAYRDTIEESKPFYPELVYEALSLILQSTYKEVIGFHHHKDNSLKGWEQAEKNQEEIVELIDKACQTLRDRIKEVQVV